MIELLEVKKHRFYNYRSVVYRVNSRDPVSGDLKVYTDETGMYFLILKQKVYFKGEFSTLEKKPKPTAEEIANRKQIIAERKKRQHELKIQAKERKRIAEQRKDLFIRLNDATEKIHRMCINVAREQDFAQLEAYVLEMEKAYERVCQPSNQQPEGD